MRKWLLYKFQANVAAEYELVSPVECSVSHNFDYQRVAGPEELKSLGEILCQSVTIPDGCWDTFSGRVGPDNFRLLRNGDRIGGGLGIYEMGQWFGGRSLRCGGISAVGISPEHRAKGAAAYLMSSALRELYEQEIPLSSLYASTQRLYRKVGYEQAGNRCYYELPLVSIDLQDRSLPLHQTALSDHKLFHKVAGLRAKFTNGNLDRTAGLWERVLSFPGKTVYGYVIGEPAEPQGYLIYYQEANPPEPMKLFVRDMAALSPAAGRSLWTFLADHRSVVGSVGWYGPAVDPLLNLTSECKIKRPGRELRWMLRIVDVTRALTQRGYPPGIDAELHLEIQDELIPANHGSFVLTVADGQAEVRAGGRGELRTDIRGLAPLYSGLLPPATLRMTGQLEADDRTVALAAQLFAGPEPWMPEMF